MQSGIQFFPLDVNTDNKIALIECEFGVQGFGVILKLWQKIYGQEGYYINWSKDVALLFSREIGVSYETITKIISAAIERDIFSAQMISQYGILTSSGIQKRYLEAVKRRKEVFLIPEFILIDIVEKYTNVHILERNVHISGKNGYTFNQIKKERMEKDDDAETAADVYKLLYNGKITDIVRHALEDAERELPLPVIKYILQLAKTDGKEWNWTKTVIKNAIKSGIKSVEEFERERERHAIQKRAGGKNGPKKNNFINYEQTASYDFEEIERRAMEKRMEAYEG